MRGFSICSLNRDVFLFCPCQCFVPLIWHLSGWELKPHQALTTTSVAPVFITDLHLQVLMPMVVRATAGPDKVWCLMLSTACSLTHDVLGDNGDDVDKILQPIVNLLRSMLNLYYKPLPRVHEPLCMWCFFLPVCEAGGVVLSQLPHAVLELFISGNEATWRSQEDANCRWFCLSSALRVQSQGIWLHWQIFLSAARLCWRRVQTCMRKRWQNQR